MNRAKVPGCLWVLCLVAVTTTGGAEAPEGPEPLFTDSGQMLGNSSTKAVAAADLDQDGDIDVFAVNDGANRVWLNDGTGEFTDSGQSLGTADSRDIVLFDLDLDSHIDAVVANFDAPNQVWWNDGSGGFSPGPTFPSNNSRGVAIGMLDDDSTGDIYIAEDDADHIYLNNGDGTFTDSGQSLDADPGYAVTLADLDQDGDLDVCVANGGTGGAFNRVWINQGNLQEGIEGEFLDSGQELGFNWTEDLALGELDTVPGIDAFTANWFPTANGVWENDGAGGFTDSGQALGSEGSLGVALADINEDSDLDAVVANNFPVGVKLWLNDGTGAFSDSGQAIAADTTVFDVAIADFNLDGAPDLFLGAFGPNSIWLRTNPEPVVPVPGFQPQLVDSRGRAGEYSAIALDSGGRPHIAYTRYLLHRDGLNYQIRYARWDGIRWNFELVFPTEDIAPFDTRPVDIALDSMNEPHIAIAASGEVTYARKQGGFWQTELVHSIPFGEEQVSIALDTLDRPHLVFTDDDDALIHGFHNGAKWVSEVIDPDTLDEAFADIAIDGGDQLHVSYYSDVDQTIRYAHRDGGVWQTETLEASKFFERPFTSIDVDSAGNPGIAYGWDDESNLKFAHWNGATWSIETARALPGSYFGGSRQSFAFDASDRPHIVYVADTRAHTEVAETFKDAGQWLIRAIERAPSLSKNLSMALDAGGEPHASYYDGDHESLRYVAWGDEFEFFPVDQAASTQATSLGVRNGAPSIGFYDTNSGQVEVADWQDPWQFDGIAFSSSPVEGVSAVAHHNRLHVSHYDADNQRLIYTRWDNGIESSVVVDETGDVGSFNAITTVGENDGFRRIAYWDASNQWIRLALLNGNDPPVRHVNDQAPSLNADSGYVAITELPDLDVGVSYYDGVNGDLRLGIWDSSTNSWADHLVAGNASDAGRHHDLQFDGGDGVPVLAYWDETAEEIRLAHGNPPAITDVPVVDGVPGLTSLSLTLNMDSRRQSRIFYSTDDGSQYLASLDKGLWHVKVLLGPSAAVRDRTSMSGQERLRFSFADSIDGLMYAHRVPNLEFAELPGEPTMLGDGVSYNPLDGCIAFLLLILGGDGEGPSNAPEGRTPDTLQGLTAPLTDQEVFSALAALFTLSQGGQFYIDLYRSHGSEMGRIALEDPLLARDAYGVLQGFMPGLEALVTDTGSELLIDQDQVDRALDLWNRIAAAGSSELLAAINTELAKYNNLQDFVGLSFDEWANAIGVSTPTQLEVIFRHGFE